MKKFYWRSTFIFSSDKKLDNIDKVRTRLYGIIADPYSLYAHIGSDGHTEEDAFTLLIFSERKPDGLRTAQAIREEFKQEAVLFEVVRTGAYLATK